MDAKTSSKLQILGKPDDPDLQIAGGMARIAGLDSQKTASWIAR